ncbi:hypothetical protein [Mycobacterium palustre]|uniref:Uncharacterized protein n=1 Tax=Mycobacterium palustre TaxID=153971 RepID=A0A1X1ZC94_9MYCO|nr:hypothetical protein [Mycobacterium palustre]MCV7100056.1 hypothetical protein [Mycobacterium palustre]ORW20928.1 hypothetical protein AWC19_14285 [Mycobacterium palustre]
MTNWAAELFPQHARRSGAAAVLEAADHARAEMRRAATAERDTQVLDELDRIDAYDQQETRS